MAAKFSLYTKRVCLLFVIVSLLIHSTECNPSTCKLAQTCGQCIENPDCSWCRDPDLAIDQRCRARGQTPDGVQGQCLSGEDPQSKVEVLENAEIDPVTTDNIVLIQPQKVKLTLRPGEKQHQTITFKTGQSKQYPLDIYFLLDLSWSMDKSRNNFAEQAGNIISDIKKITEDVWVGFGSFVDKNLPPFASTYNEFNCPPENPNCTPPYSFLHKTSLKNMNESEFKNEVFAAPLAGNVDEPEGGLDALMQVMACTDRIGWRRVSRKIILVATDRDFHYAMDGKLVGILEPNDGNCHLDEKGLYTHSTLLDYPSISHINYVANTNSFVVIFAVIPRYKSIYEAMANLVTGSSVEILEKDSQNIVQLIRSRYKDITSTVQVAVNNVPDGLRIVLKSDCGKGGDPIETNSCGEVELGTSVTFKVEARATRCLEPGQTTFSISPVGLNQSMEVQVETLCKCGCEIPDAGLGYEFESPNCKSRGDDACGICICQPEYSGPSCECDSKSVPDADDPNAQCKDPKQPDKICNGVGICKCGVCSCTPESQTYGRFCECDDVSCIRTNGQFCSGNGKCTCGVCNCNENWSGDDCSCYENEEYCLSPYNRLKCSGFGTCQCSKCKCNTDSSGGVYSGSYCERGPNEAFPCSILRYCVECQAFESGPMKEKCNELCYFELEQIHVENATQDFAIDEKCSFENAAGCTFVFSSIYEPEIGLNVYLHIIDGQKEQCPQVDALGISLGIFLTLLLIGLATIAVYIAFIRIKDRRAVARFEKEAQNMRWATNETPLYKSPVSTYQNPMYNKAN